MVQQTIPVTSGQQQICIAPIEASRMATYAEMMLFTVVERMKSQDS